MDPPLISEITIQKMEILTLFLGLGWEIYGMWTKDGPVHASELKLKMPMNCGLIIFVNVNIHLILTQHQILTDQHFVTEETVIPSDLNTYVITCRQYFENIFKSYQEWYGYRDVRNIGILDIFVQGVEGWGGYQGLWESKGIAGTKGAFECALHSDQFVVKFHRGF